MNDIYDLKEVFEKAEKLHSEMLKEYRVNGRVVDEEHTRRFNTLAFAIDSAVEKLKKGLEGEF